MLLRFAGYAVLMLVWTVLPAQALDPGEMFDEPAKEERARDIGRKLRCLVCQNQSIFDSNSGLAKDLRALVRERMDAGDSDQDVIEFVAARYGDYVRLKPPLGVHTLVLWLAPVLFLGLGFGLVANYFIRRSAPARLADSDREAARRLLEGDIR